MNDRNTAGRNDASERELDCDWRLDASIATVKVGLHLYITFSQADEHIAWQVASKQLAAFYLGHSYAVTVLLD